MRSVMELGKSRGQKFNSNGSLDSGNVDSTVDNPTVPSESTREVAVESVKKYVELSRNDPRMMRLLDPPSK